MVTVVRWTGREARALRTALRMSGRDFANHTGLSTSAIADLEAKGEQAQLRHATQQILDDTLAKASDEAKQRFCAILGDTVLQSTETAANEVDRRRASRWLESDPAGGQTATQAEGAEVGQEAPGQATDGPLWSDRLGLVWQAELRDTVNTVRGLWTADLQRRSVVMGATWLASAFAAPVRGWLLDRLDASTGHTGGRRVGQADVDALWQMCHLFADTDHRLGGGYARSTLARFVTDVALPLLDGTYNAEAGRGLMAAIARLCDLGGFMAFDAGARHGLAQRYYIQALRLAQAGHDRALGAHILADMSMQAQHLGDTSEAVALAQAGQRTARDCGSACTLARCTALEARAHARAGDAHACGQAMNRAERAFAKAAPGEEPSWISFFTAAQLSAEFMYAAHDLGAPDAVQRFASSLPAPDGQMQRRHVLASATLASSYLMRPGQADVDQACATLATVVPVVGAVTSSRGVQAINKVRRRLTRHRRHPTVQKIETELGAVLGAAA